MTEKLTDEALAVILEGLPGWVLRDEKLHRVLTFADFVEAFGFMAQVALVAERMNHHPE
ncbi:MAG: 4a-hydroxytetrahydrobiopterin dehydratase, partial [Thiothrix litoralis]